MQAVWPNSIYSWMSTFFFFSFLNIFKTDNGQFQKWTRPLKILGSHQVQGETIIMQVTAETVLHTKVESVILLQNILKFKDFCNICKYNIYIANQYAKMQMNNSLQNHISSRKV
jgi:hypothetical protein